MTKRFRYMSSVFYSMALRGGQRWADLYAKYWNPINYAAVGGIGLIINYLVFSILIRWLPWYFTNFIAIVIAWLWNWINSVGALGYLWGFRKRP